MQMTTSRGGRSAVQDRAREMIAGMLICGAVLLAGGCGGDTGSEPEDKPDCAISNVNTSMEDDWLTGETVNIRWTRNGVPATVVIELLKGGVVVDAIAAETANDGFHPWTASTAGQPNGSDFGIRVTGTGTPACTGEVGGLTITNVAGCALSFGAIADSIGAGDAVTVTWTGQNGTGNVDIELWDSGPGTALGELIGVIVYGAPDTGTYVWNADSFHNGTYRFYRYVIRDAVVRTCAGVSPQFEMTDTEVCGITVVGPAQDQVLTAGSSLTIQLDQSNGSGRVNLRLYAGEEFVSGGQIADNISVLDDFVWTVTRYGHTQTNNRYEIKAFDVADGYCTGETNRFTITP